MDVMLLSYMHENFSHGKEHLKCILYYVKSILLLYLQTLKYSIFFFIIYMQEHPMLVIVYKEFHYMPRVVEIHTQLAIDYKLVFFPTTKFVGLFPKKCILKQMY